MESAAKKKNSLAMGVVASMIVWASALLFSSAANASSVGHEGQKSRAEVSGPFTAKSVELLAANPVNATRYYDASEEVALECTVAPKGGYLTPGIGSSVPGQNFTHGWIKHDLYNQLNGLVGKADMNKFLAALKKGIVGPTGESGIKIFSSPVGKYTHELKIGGSAQRILGYIDENGVLIFDKFVRGGLH